MSEALFQLGNVCSISTASDDRLTDTEDDLEDVNGVEVQEEEGEVDDEKEEAQNHAHPLLEPLT